MKNNAIIRWLLLGLVVLAIIGGLAGYKYREISAAIAFAEAMPEHSESVKAVHPSIVLWTPSVESVGEIKAARQLVLRNELDGTITRVNFRAGEPVRKGQVLLELDAREERAQYQSASVSADLARRVLKRSSQLKDEGALSEDAYDQAQATLGISLAQMDRLKAIISKKTLRAPFDAVSGLHALEVGQYLPLNTEITTLVGRDANYWVDFTLAQQHLLNDGASVVIESPDAAHEKVSAQIIASDATVSQDTRHLSYRAEFNDAAGRFKPGMLVTVKIIRAAPMQVVELPNTSVLRDKFQSYVYALEKDEAGIVRAQKVSVTVLAESGDAVIVEGKLNANTWVASNGAFKLYPGLKVNVMSSEIDDSQAANDAINADDRSVRL
ncbi:Multidrug resistance protein MdtE [BD1-7 clade bacterium]|uniref:Multidrug resistance protein MdtE n=1 Tax=BD1-7 clade bacterium TaxID=2029982 RepID=A0A5S9PMG3_9GAMM|nr:Multidrug resistance protein MdtE [BD1-7 clade bacterium]